MPELILSGRPVPTVFDLLGHSEDDMTSSLAWGLSRSDALLRAMLVHLDIEPGPGEAVIRLQQHDAAGGFTDIEISDGTSFHVIIEAKRGWWLPAREQLALYAQRLSTSGTASPRLVVLTQWGAESAAQAAIAAMDLPYRCDVLGWSDVVGLVRAAGTKGDRATTRWLHELDRYLREVTDMRDTESNSVYVVSLGRVRPEGWPHDFLEIATQFGRYFFPASGKNWPKTPPNYMAFRTSRRN